ncbi:MAG TPA: hypothetical protein VFC29_22535 [Candidatus Limnocylindrales bacterium]|jgi:hypothetical protein|nr:hypothetical protein [Candidatus Limnocylindrales bacterium]
MDTEQTVTAVLSVVAIVISVVSIVLQYRVVVDLKCRLNTVLFDSPPPQGAQPRSGFISVRLSFFNLGNRPASVESISMFVVGGDYDALQKNPPRSCDGDKRFLVPISKASHSKLSIDPFVVDQQGIAALEFVFDMFFFQAANPDVAFAGAVCLAIECSDANGRSASVAMPVALVDVAMHRPNDELNLRFDVTTCKKEGTLFPLL